MTNSFLNVTESFTHRLWVSRPYDERQAEAMAQRYTLPDMMARSLAARGIDVETAASFLEPRLRALLPDPSLFKDMDVAAARFVAAIQKSEKIAVFGDFDVDGATSSALLVRFTRALGRDMTVYIPDRVREGYGPNEAALRKLKEDGATLVVCVDCGTTAHEPLRAAHAMGLDVIVLDHHAAEAALPPAIAVVNPNRLDDPLAEKFGALAAVGVTYLFVIAVNRALRKAGFYNEERKEPDLLQWLDLVALGTVCDVVKLTGLNRTFVAQGLKVMEKRANPGLAALAQTAGARRELDTFAAGFLLGPRINAGGRIGRADMGARLLSSDDLAETTQLAEELNALNAQRKTLEAEVLAEAEMTLFDDACALTFVASENWHPGVIGIVASRLKDKFHRPAIVIALENGVGKGSGRSVACLDLGAAVIAARQAGLLINGGGHRMAAGLTVARDKIDALHAFLEERISKQLAAEPFVPTLTLDGLVSAQAATVPFIEKLAALAPFGTGNPEPRFAVPDCTIVRADIVGEKHVKLIAQQGGARLAAIAFRAMEGPLGPSLLAHGGRKLHLAGALRSNEWQGKVSVQLVVEDASPSNAA